MTSLLNRLSLLSKEVRAVRLHYQSPTVARMCPSSDALAERESGTVDGTTEATMSSPIPIDHLTQRFVSLEQTHNALQRTEELLRAAGDRRSVFLTIYVKMTKGVIQGIEMGAFHDSVWARKYLIEFANWYREALLNFEHGNLQAVPQPWQLAFSASRSGHTLVIQDLLLGVNAHINYDLAYTLDEISIDPKRAKKLQDHNRINRILASLVDTAQSILSELYSAAGLAEVDVSLGHFDEWFTLFSLTEARDLAWKNATSLASSRWRLQRRYTDWKINTFATGAAYFVLAPSADRSILWSLRSVEGAAPIADQLSAELKHQVDTR
jgi:hypothetical protein